MKKTVPRKFLARSRDLRRESTNAERRLWYSLRNRQLIGAKFRRQHVIEPYVVDFFCFEKNLAIELDGGGHAEEDRVEYDEERTLYLEGKGIRVLRFWNNEILNNTEGVLERIKAILEGREEADETR